MKERPILFSAPMVRALLDGSKTQTRRVLYVTTKVMKNACMDRRYPDDGPLEPFGKIRTLSAWRHAKPGDRLWVRETWLPDPNCDDDSWDEHTCSYFEWSGCGGRIDGLPAAMQKPEHCIYRGDWDGPEMVWRPSIHMPRWACRITLEIVAVRVERLNNISEGDAQAEGAVKEPYGCAPGYEAYTREYREGYRKLWESINGAGSWAANPWVVVLEFKVVTP